ncbi:MAG TPA: hypothetical protein VLB01_05695 [Thermodesulfobacteriota bacterium]|nr:hypothetical protein [Thermodesulfobacteriota bacterium]
MLDYIKIVGVSDIDPISSDVFNVTFNIVYSIDSAFRDPRRGMFTINLFDFIQIPDVRRQEVLEVVSRLTGQVLIRGKGEDGEVMVLHLLGMSLSDWLAKNVLPNKNS